MEAIRAWCELESITDPAERRNVRVAVDMLDGAWIAAQRQQQRRG